jgi:hypothetical protein
MLSNSVYRNAGTHRIATNMRWSGWDVEVVDFLPYWTSKSLKRFFKKTVTKNTKFIGISSVFNNDFAEDVHNLILWIRKSYPNLYIIVGSNVVPSQPFYAVDYYIVGYAEKALRLLCEYLFSNGKKPKVEKRKIILANQNYLAAPFNKPLVEYQKRDYIEPYDALGIEFSRGCIFTCSFCNFPLLGVKEDYTRTAQSFQHQVQQTYDEWGVTNWYVSDETFNDSTQKIRKYADVVEKLDFKPLFSGFIRPDLLISRKQEKEELARMNFIGHFYGVETFNHDAGKIVGKGMNPDKMKQGLIDIKDYFSKHTDTYRGNISLIVGLPHESFDDLDETADWVNQHWRDQSITQWSLEIPRSQGHGDSLFTKNYHHYGYSDIDGHEEDIEDATFESRNDVYFWENEHMNCFSAADYSRDWQSHLQNTHPVDNWGLFTQLDDTTTWQELYSLSFAKWNQFVDTHIITYVNKYIERKLQ